MQVLDLNGLKKLWSSANSTFVAKVAGKALSTNDFTNDYKTKVDNLVTASRTAVTSVAGRTGAVTLTSSDITNFATAVSSATSSIKSTADAAKKVTDTFTGTSLDNAIADAKKAGTDAAAAAKTANDAIAGLVKFDIVKVNSVQLLPQTGTKGTIYIIPDTHSDSNDSYDEYIWNTAVSPNAYEKIGNTDVNLSDYVTQLQFNEGLEPINTALSTHGGKIDNINTSLEQQNISDTAKTDSTPASVTFTYAKSGGLYNSYILSAISDTDIDNIIAGK